MHEGGGAAGLTQTQVLATAAGAAVLLYAGMLDFPVSSTIDTWQRHLLVVLGQIV